MTEANPQAEPQISFETVEARDDMHGVMVIYGQPKIGKSNLAASLTEVTIDTENGLNHLSGVIRLRVNKLSELRKAIDYCEAQGIKSISIDTIDKVYEWLTKFICQQYKVKALGEIKWGAGWDQATDYILGMMNDWRKRFDLIVIVAHQRLAIIDETSRTARQIDLPGKLSRKFAGEADQLGFCEVERDEDGGQHRFINFKPYEDVDSGGRLEALEEKRIEFFKSRSKNLRIFEKIFEEHHNHENAEEEETDETKEDIHASAVADSPGDPEAGER
jgi:hypothetical protein